MPARKWLQVEKTAEVASENYEFIKKLWKSDDQPIGQRLRDTLIAHSNPNDLRSALALAGFQIAPKDITVQIMLVDVARGETKFLPEKDFDRGKDFYVLVLPPAPVKKGEPAQVDWQAWLEASFHASNDGYGM
jgi:hypothetical protein